LYFDSNAFSILSSNAKISELTNAMVNSQLGI
jgi:hypothetical protein